MGILKSWEQSYTNANWEALVDISESIANITWSDCAQNKTAYTKSTLLLKNIYSVLRRIRND